MPNTVNVTGGAQMNAALRKIAQMLGKGGTVSVGFLEKAKYPNGTPVAMIAAIQNYGAPSRNIPPRPFFSNMVRDKSPSWPSAVQQNLKATNYDVRTTLERVGAGIKGQLQQSIVDTNSPALSPKTIARKGSAKPLIETGHMLNSVDYSVQTK